MPLTEQKSFRKALLTLAIPLALQQLLNALVGATDALVLGRLHQEAIAAVSLANQISFIMSLFTGSVIGSVSVLVAQYWASRTMPRPDAFWAWPSGMWRPFPWSSSAGPISSPGS